MKRLDQLNIFRFVASLQIVVYHYAKNTYPFTVEPWLRIPNGEGFVVSFFFVLSGFVLVYVSQEQGKKEEISWKPFIVKRLSRFLPLYLATLVLIFPFRFGEIPNTLTGAALYIFLIQAWVPAYAQAFNSSAWAMSVFFAIYLFFPLFYRWLVRQSVSRSFYVIGFFWLVSQVVIHVIFNQWYTGADTLLHNFLLFNPLFHLNTFMLGAWSAVFYRQQVRAGLDRPALRLFLLLAINALIVLFTFIRGDIQAFVPFRLTFNNGLVAPMYLTLILLLAMDKTAISRFLSRPVLVTLGDLSFSIYLLQTPMVEVYKQLLLPRMEYYFPWTSQIHFYFYLPLLLITAYLSRRFFEIPAQKFIRKRFI